jgi:hypothetical protein
MKLIVLPKEFKYTLGDELFMDKQSGAYKIIAGHKKTYVEYVLIMKFLINPIKETVALLEKEQYINGKIEQLPDEYIIIENNNTENNNTENNSIYNGAKLLLPRSKFDHVRHYNGGVPISIMNYYEKQLVNLLDELVISTPYNKSNYKFVINRATTILVLILKKIKLLHQAGYAYNGLTIGNIHGNHDLGEIVLTGVTATLYGEDYTSVEFNAMKNADVKSVLAIFRKFLNKLRNTNKLQRLLTIISGDITHIPELLRKLPKNKEPF